VSRRGDTKVISQKKKSCTVLDLGTEEKSKSLGDFLAGVGGGGGGGSV